MTWEERHTTTGFQGESLHGKSAWADQDLYSLTFKSTWEGEVGLEKALGRLSSGPSLLGSTRPLERLPPSFLPLGCIFQGEEFGFSRAHSKDGSPLFLDLYLPLR